VEADATIKHRETRRRRPTVLAVAEQHKIAHVLLVRIGGGLVVAVEVGRLSVVVVILLLLVVLALGRPREALEDGFFVVLLRVVVRRAEGVGGVGACAGSQRVAARRGSRPAGRGGPRVAAL